MARFLRTAARPPTSSMDVVRLSVCHPKLGAGCDRER